MFSIRLESLTCDEETSELSASDEPYVMIAAVDRSGPLPQVQVVLQTFTDVDAGETHPSHLPPFWGLHGIPADLDSPEGAVFIAVLMENDDGNPESVRGLVSSASAVAVASTLGQPHEVVAGALLQNISDMVQLPTGFPNFDDLIGVQELRFTSAELDRARGRENVLRTLSFRGDGGRYRLNFSLRMDRYFRTPDYRWVRLQGYLVAPGAEGSGRGLVRMDSFYDRFRGDNFLTSDPAYVGRSTIEPSYGFSRTEGFAFSPADPRPAGAVPLHSWWSPVRKDNFATSDPRYVDPPAHAIAPGYRHYRLEGYLHSPESPQPPGTVPLHSWYSPSRQDNAALSHPSWIP